MIAVYVWCDCGMEGPRHYYTEDCCPFSGWVAPHVEEVQGAAATLRAAAKPVTILALREAGVSPQGLKRVLIAEYSDAVEVPVALGVGSFGEQVRL